MTQTINTLLEIYGMETFRRHLMTITIMMDQARSDGLISRQEWQEWESRRLFDKNLEKDYLTSILLNGKV